MSRKGIKNKRTLIREANLRIAAEEAALIASGKADVKVLVDSLGVMEEAMRYFRGQALNEQKKKSANPDTIRTAFRDAAQIAALAAPYKHYKLAAVRVVGDVNKKPVDEATAAQLWDEIVTKMAALGLVPAMGVANRGDGDGRPN